MSIGCSISGFDIGYFNSLTKLFSEHFSENDKVLSKAYSEWLYLNNPFGPAQIVTAAQDGHWLGFMALVPVRLARMGEIRSGYFVVNVLVHRKQRGKNIFAMMIERAIEYVKTENAILMGHPNAMAYGGWKRAAMHFQAPLMPYFVMPKFVQRNSITHPVTKVSELDHTINQSIDQELKSHELTTLVSARYLEWRYLEHPTNNYQLLAINVNRRPVGLIAVKNMYTGINLLIDQFGLNGYLEAGLGGAPLFTVAFLPEALSKDCPRLWAAPLRRTLPFFCTDYEKPIEASEVMRLGLSASDF